MITALLVGPAVLLAGVLIASGALKLRGPADLTEFEQLGVPQAFHRKWIAVAHPWGELVLGIMLLIAGGWLGALAALAGTLLMAAYLVLVVRARRATPDASCACFGSTKRITALTIARNAWLTLLGVLAVAAAWALPLLGGPLAALSVSGWAWIGIVVAAVVTTALVMWPDGTASRASDPVPDAVVAAAGDDDLDYIRSITPAVPVTLADGSTQTLRELSSQRPMLMLAVSATCGSCTKTIADRERWRALLPELDIRLVMTSMPEETEITEHEHPMSLHDPDRRVAPSFGYTSTPSAVLFGMDGMLAGGPVSGTEAIEEFVGDVYESLRGERPPA